MVLSGNTGPSSILDGSGTGTIVNDDGTISQISIGDASGLENGGPLTFSISLDVPSGFPISVDYQTNDGSATTANNDYVPASGTVTFGPKDTKKTVVVQLVADCGVEPDELFTVTLSNNTGPSTIADGSGHRDDPERRRGGEPCLRPDRSAADDGERRRRHDQDQS